MVWHERKNESNRLRMAQSVQKEEEELTFSPNINQKSKYLAAARAFKGGGSTNRITTPVGRSMGSAPFPKYAYGEHSTGGSRYSVDSDRVHSSGGSRASGKRSARKPPKTEFGIEKNWFGFGE